MSENSKGVMFAIATAMLWGVLAIVLKYSTEFLDSVSIVFFRFLLASIGLNLLLLRKDRAAFSILKRPPKLLILAAGALLANYMGFMYGIELTSSEHAQIIIQTGPLLLALAGLVIFKEHFTPRQIVGFIVAIIGFTIFFSSQMGGGIDSSSLNRGSISIIFGAVSWATYAVLQKRLVKDYSTNHLNIVIFGLPAIALAPFVDYGAVADMLWWQWLIILFLGLNTLAAYTLLSEALKRTEAGKVSMIITMNPIITFLVLFIARESGASWASGDNVSLIAFSGAVMVLSGAVMVLLKIKRRSKLIR